MTNSGAVEKALKYLGLARKAGALAVGEEAVREAARLGRAKLILLARDASESTADRIRSIPVGKKTAVLTFPSGKEELALALGLPLFAAAAVTDVGLAAACVSALTSEVPEYSGAAELLAKRKQKLMRRRGSIKEKREDSI